MLHIGRRGRTTGRRHAGPTRGRRDRLAPCSVPVSRSTGHLTIGAVRSAIREAVRTRAVVDPAAQRTNRPTAGDFGWPATVPIAA
jgi:hypothetical protein